MLEVVQKALVGRAQKPIGLLGLPRKCVTRFALQPVLWYEMQWKCTGKLLGIQSFRVGDGEGVSMYTSLIVLTGVHSGTLTTA